MMIYWFMDVQMDNMSLFIWNQVYYHYYCIFLHTFGEKF